MNSYERIVIADCLFSSEFEIGDLIIKQDDKGYLFFIILEGEALVWKEIDGVKIDLMTLKKGDYCGELALLFDQPRAANVTATSPLKTICLDIQNFKMVLGPVEEILKRNMKNYELYMKKQ